MPLLIIFCKLIFAFKLCSTSKAEMGEINWSLCLTKFKKKESFLVHVHLQVSLQLKLFSGRAVAVNFDPG